jgi:hypothetical protein
LNRKGRQTELSWGFRLGRRQLQSWRGRKKQAFSLLLLCLQLECSSEEFLIPKLSGA